MCLSIDPQWQGETQEFCPKAKVVLVGCKLDMRTDVNVMRELSKHRLIPVTHEQVSCVEKMSLGFSICFQFLVGICDQLEINCGIS